MTPVAVTEALTVRANLYASPSPERLKAEGHFFRPAVTSRHFQEAYRGDDYNLYATVDRRLRNPLGLGCSRGAIERIHGVEKYSEWVRTGNWLDKSEDEVLRLLRRKGETTTP